MKITVEHLTKQFDSTIAVNDLSVTIESGKMIALLGPSGCGKSTILNMLSGILPVTSGRILFDDRDVTKLPPDKRNIGLVFQNYALYPHMTVLQNICFPLEIKRMPKAQRLERAMELAELVKISSMLKRKPGELSGGQQQRVAIARALAKEPEVLLLDEPLSNLDAKLRVEMREEILRIQRASKITTIFVTHDQEEASSIADDVLLMKDGVLQQQGGARDLYNEPNNYFVADFLGAPPINKLYGEVVEAGFRFRDTDVTVALPAQVKAPVGTKVILAIRAESILYPAQDGALQGTIRARYSVNKDELSVIDLYGQQLRAFISSDYPLLQGDELQLGMKKRGVFLFDEATGARLL